MYSARTINSTAGKDFESGVPNVFEQLPATESMLAGMGGVLTCRKADFDLRGRDAWIFISIKNRGFSRSYINRFIDMCDAAGINGYICPVDDPYRYNAMAELKRDDLPQEEAEKIERLSSDVSRMAQKAINGKLSKRVEVVKWHDLEAQTPDIYREELTQAFKAGTSIRDHLFDHVSSVKPIENERDFERYAEFFLCEVPVLMHTYYSKGATIDIYPGRQPAFFWKIELGQFADELPEMTTMTQQGRPMLYLDTHDRSETKVRPQS